MDNTVDMDEFRFLLTGGISAGEVPPNPLPWLGDKLWAEINRLPSFLAFVGFAEELQQDPVSPLSALSSHQYNKHGTTLQILDCPFLSFANQTNCLMCRYCSMCCAALLSRCMATLGTFGFFCTSVCESQQGFAILGCNKSLDDASHLQRPVSADSCCT